MGRLSKFTIANVDPFNIEARGAKFPDSNTLPSVTATFPYAFTMSLDGNGNAASCFRASPEKGHLPAYSVSVGDVVTWDDLSDVSSIDYDGIPPNSEYYLWRSVGGGIKITYAGDPDLYGTIHVAYGPDIYNATEFAYPQMPTTETEFDSSPWSETVTVQDVLEDGRVFPFKKYESSESRYLRNGLNESSVDEKSPNLHSGSGWCNIYVFVTGGAAGTQISIDAVMHMEMLQNLSNASWIDATPAHPYNDVALSVVQQAHTNLLGYKEGTGHIVLRRLLKTVIHGGIKLGANYLLGGTPAAASAARLLIEGAGTYL